MASEDDRQNFEKLLLKSDLNGSDPKQHKGYLYEDPQGRRHNHGNSHATGATDIESNQYQGPEVVDKIPLHHNVSEVYFLYIRSLKILIKALFLS